MGITLSESYPVRLPEVARRRTLWTAGGRLAAWEAAPAAPVPVRGVVVLLPGFTGSKEDFIPLLSPIAAAGYRVIAYDQRGQYESDGPARVRAYSMELFARDLREVIGMVGDGGPVHLAGHSFGGLVARNLVIAEPALVRSLTLLDSGPAGASLLRARWLGLLVGLIRLFRRAGCPGCATGWCARSVPAWWGCAWRCHASRIASMNSHPRRSQFLSSLVKMMTFGLPRCRKKWPDVSMRPLP